MKTYIADCTRKTSSVYVGAILDKQLWGYEQSVDTMLVKRRLAKQAASRKEVIQAPSYILNMIRYDYVMSFHAEPTAYSLSQQSSSLKNCDFVDETLYDFFGKFLHLHVHVTCTRGRLHVHYDMQC